MQVSSEKEVLRREVAEMCDRVQLLEKASRQLELDNERLAFKVNMNVIVLYISHHFKGIRMLIYYTFLVSSVH